MHSFAKSLFFAFVGASVLASPINPGYECTVSNRQFRFKDAADLIDRLMSNICPKNIDPTEFRNRLSQCAIDLDRTDPGVQQYLQDLSRQRRLPDNGTLQEMLDRLFSSPPRRESLTVDAPTPSTDSLVSSVMNCVKCEQDGDNHRSGESEEPQSDDHPPSDHTNNSSENNHPSGQPSQPDAQSQDNSPSNNQPSDNRSNDQPSGNRSNNQPSDNRPNDSRPSNPPTSRPSNNDSNPSDNDSPLNMVLGWIGMGGQESGREGEGPWIEADNKGNNDEVEYGDEDLQQSAPAKPADERVNVQPKNSGDREWVEVNMRDLN